MLVAEFGMLDAQLTTLTRLLDSLTAGTEAAAAAAAANGAGGDDIAEVAPAAAGVGAAAASDALLSSMMDEAFTEDESELELIRREVGIITLLHLQYGFWYICKQMQVCIWHRRHRST
jgi:hypothetical protein